MAPEESSPAGIQRPNIAPRIFYIDANPNKRVVTTTAQVYPPDLALFELIDNSIDGWRANNQPAALSSVSETPEKATQLLRPLKITLDLSFKKDVLDEVVVRDNAGGVPEDRLRALLQPGAVNMNPDAIGTWGQGLKVATYALARDVVIRTRHGEGPLHEIHIDEQWWKSGQWQVRVLQYPESEFPAGATEIVLSDLRKPLTRAEVYADETEAGGDTLLQRVAQTYTPLLAGMLQEQIEIRAVLDRTQEVPLKPSLIGDIGRADEFFAFPPGYEPTRHITAFESGSRTLKVEALVGLLPEQSRTLSGVTMYGKGRLFELALKENKVGFGTRGPAKIPASHPTTWRLVILLFFEGAPSDIPWRAPAKFGYNENNEFHDQLRAFLIQIAEPYAIFTKLAKRLDILPYSTRWNTLPPENREKEIRSFTGIPKIEDFLAVNPHLAGRFARGEIVTVDHSAPIPTSRPATSIAVSQRAARFLRNRKQSDPRDLWTPANLRQVATVAKSSISQPKERVTGGEGKDPWLETHRLTISLPLPVYLTIVEAAGGDSLGEWVREAVDRRAGEHDGIHRIKNLTFRRVVDHARRLILDNLPDADGIMIFGSVVRENAADRESDIDILIVHEDKVRAQQVANRVLSGFVLRDAWGEEHNRYTINPLVLSRRSFEEQARSGTRFRESFKEGVWVHAKAGFTPQEVPP